MGSIGANISKIQYRYHGTSAQNLISIYKNGLLPSKRGQRGKGVYFAYDENSAEDWGAEQNRTNNPNIKILRVSMPNLSKFSYKDVDDEQGVAGKKIPSEYIQIKNRQGEWESLDTYAHRYYRTFGIKE